MPIVNRTRGCTLATDETYAETFLTRGVGLLRHARLEEGEGLVIRPCNSVHTWFMRFSIDVLFVAQDGTLVHIIEDMRPWKLSRIYFKAVEVVELPSGTCARTGTVVGDRLSYQREAVT